MFLAVAVAGLLFGPAGALAAGAETPQATPPAHERPGYGVVESIRVIPPEASASAGASGAADKAQPRYLVRVRMDDGSVQVRSVELRSGIRHEVRAGQRVLVTNAGDIVPE